MTSRPGHVSPKKDPIQ